MRWLGLLFWLLLCLAVGGVSGAWTAGEIPGWYRTLTQPSIAPPNWVFAPVWSTLYVLMAVAAWRVWLAPQSPLRTWGLALFLVQLALNFGWSLIFFKMHALGTALAEVVLLWLAIAGVTALFSRVSLPAAWMMAPYLAWVTFASILNGAFWRLNRG